MTRSFLTLLLLVPLTGCAALLIQPEDSTAIKAAKVAARVPLALGSVGNSEIGYHCARQPDAPPVLTAVGAWVGLTPEERLDTCWEQVQANWAGSDSGG